MISTRAKSQTVADLLAFLHRQKAALSEVGRSDLAERAHIVIYEDRLAVSFNRPPAEVGPHSVEALKALELDPEFEKVNQAMNGGPR